MSNRMERANTEIQKAISEIFLKDMNDPRFSSLMTVSDVKTTPDFKYCKVKVSVLEKNESERQLMLSLLKKSSSYIRKLLCENVKMPSAPFLTFELDEGVLHSERINEILENLVIPPIDENEEE